MNSSQQLQADLPIGHSDINDLFTGRPREFPSWHVDVSRILSTEPIQKVEVFLDHPDPHEMFANKERIPRSHPSVTAMLYEYLPPSHGDIDELLRNPESHPLPVFHPSLNSFLSFDSSINHVTDGTSNAHSSSTSSANGSQLSPSSTSTANGSQQSSSYSSSVSSLPVFSVFYGHPDLETEYEQGDPVDHHPSIHYMMESYLPDYHPNIDDLLREGFVLPSWHPAISNMVKPRSLATSPASMMSYIIASLFVAMLLLRSARKLKSRTMEMPLVFPGGLEGNSKEISQTYQSSDDESENSIYVEPVMTGDDNNDDSAEVDNVYEGVLPGLDNRRHQAMELHKKHRDSTLAPKSEHVRESILVYREKKNNELRSRWTKIFGRRAKSDLSTGEATLCLSYILINVVALLISPTYQLKVGFGSLSAGNTLFLVMTATRNSVITWILGVTFEHVLVYHRFIGRLTVVVSLIHSVFYIDQIIERISDRVTVTGLVSLGCSVIIFLSSLNYFRRKHFNIFFWSHFSFVGFIIGMYLHAPASQPYILASVVCYGVDKLLQMIWTQLPRKTIIFEKVGDRTARVKYDRTPLANLLARQKVGQYVFVNFPELSLNEWHVSYAARLVGYFISILIASLTLAPYTPQPFSVASSPCDTKIELYIRAYVTDFVFKLISLPCLFY